MDPVDPHIHVVDLGQRPGGEHPGAAFAEDGPARSPLVGRSSSLHNTHDGRDDIRLEQILDMIVAIATIHGDTRYLEPILQTSLDGLRPPTDVEPA